MKGVSALRKERLTDYISKQKIYDHIKAQINPYGKPFDGTTYEFGLKIMDYIKNSSCDEEIEEQGLLLRLPVAVGQTLYTNQRKTGWYFRLKDAPYRVQVGYIGISNSTEMGGGFFNVSYEKHDCMIQFNFSDIGKTVFLTQSEAEEKLRELEDGECQN